MEIKNGERKNQDKSKVMLVFDYDGTIQETIKIYAPAIFDIAKRLRTIYDVPVENPSYARMESLKMKKCGQTSPQRSLRPLRRPHRRGSAPTCALWFAMVLIPGILVLVTP